LYNRPQKWHNIKQLSARTMLQTLPEHLLLKELKGKILGCLGRLINDRIGQQGIESNFKSNKMLK
jgi:hypothetical protein